MPSNDVWDYITKLEQRIKTLENGRTLRAVVIPEGGVRITNSGVLIVQSADGVNLFYLGPLISGGVPLRGFLLRRENGKSMFSNGVAGGDPNKVFFAWKDNAENILFSDDANAGVGISRPWLSMPSVPVAATSIPTTTGATFLSVYSTGYMLKQQPNIELQALLYSTGGGVGEARYTVNGVAIGSTMTINNGDFAWTSPVSLTPPQAHNTYIRTELQVRRTNGAGSVGGVLVASQRSS
ncbi:hypothetical protein PV646_28850 [Streptomyces sp. ID05-26A]|nr:hypothetical protein [Streptomyces sp. ID05-26A]